MFDARSEFLNGDWEVFQKHRITQETERMCSHRQVLKGIEWLLVA